MSKLKREFQHRILMECLATIAIAEERGDHETMLFVTDVLETVFDLEMNKATQVSISQN
jgi:ATP-dependent Clp protease adapter protein ClpS